MNKYVPATILALAVAYLALFAVCAMKGNTAAPKTLTPQEKVAPLANHNGPVVEINGTIR